MGDIVDRLRFMGKSRILDPHTADKAADEIERQRAALQKIAESDDMYEPGGWAILTARAALKESSE